MGPVFTTPCGVMSKTQESTKATGNPTISRIITKVTVQSGSPSLGNIISAASMMIKAVAAYMAMTLGTPHRFSSCQNPGLLFDIYVKDEFYAIYKLEPKKSNAPNAECINLIILEEMAGEVYRKINYLSNFIASPDLIDDWFSRLLQFVPKIIVYFNGWEIYS